MSDGKPPEQTTEDAFLRKENITPADEAAARRKIGCFPRPTLPVEGYAADGDLVWCWCSFEIIGGIGQCRECQSAEDMSGYDY